jgi:hypothetical protein
MVDAVRRPAWRVGVLSEPARAVLVAAGALPVKPGERTLLLTLAPAESGGDQAAALLQALHDLGLCDPALGCLTPRLRDPWLGHSALGDPGLRDSGPPAGPARHGLSAREVEIMRHLVAGLSKLRDRRCPVHLPEDRQEPPEQHLRQAGRAHPVGRGRDLARHPAARPGRRVTAPAFSPAAEPCQARSASRRPGPTVSHKSRRRPRIEDTGTAATGATGG